MALDIISGCSIVFAAVWLLAAVSTKRTVYRENRAQRLRYWVLLVIAYLLLARGRQLPYPLNLRVVSEMQRRSHWRPRSYASLAWPSRFGPDLFSGATGAVW